MVVFESDASYARASAPRSAGGIRQQFSLPVNVELSLYGIDFLKRGLKDRARDIMKWMISKHLDPMEKWIYIYIHIYIYVYICAHTHTLFFGCFDGSSVSVPCLSPPLHVNDFAQKFMQLLCRSFAKELCFADVWKLS